MESSYHRHLESSIQYHFSGPKFKGPSGPALILQLHQQAVRPPSIPAPPGAWVQASGASPFRPLSFSTFHPARWGPGDTRGARVGDVPGPQSFLEIRPGPTAAVHCPNLRRQNLRHHLIPLGVLKCVWEPGEEVSKATPRPARHPQPQHPSCQPAKNYQRPLRSTQGREKGHGSRGGTDIPNS